MSVEAILQPYVDAPTLVAAEAELDRLARRSTELPEPLGDLYDDLAHAAAEDNEYELAARLEAKALEAGCSQRLVAREMRGWYLLKSGATDEGEAVFRALLAERPDDADVRITLGHARSDAGLRGAALEAFDDALAAAKRRGLSKEIDRAGSSDAPSASTSGSRSTRTIASPPRPDLRARVRSPGPWRGSHPTSTRLPWSAGPAWLTTSRIRCATHGASRSSCEGSMPPSGTGPRSRR